MKHFQYKMSIFGENQIFPGFENENDWLNIDF